MAAKTKTTNPIAAEALALPIAFVFEGHEYAVLPTSEWTIDALEHFETGKIVGMLREILDAENFATFRARHKKVSDLNNFVVAMQTAQGIAGN